MKNTFKYIAALVAVTAAFLSFGPTAMAQDGSVKYDKTCTKEPDANGIYTISMEAYVTGTVTVTTETKPADIVLVLDYSQSMENNMEGTSTNVQAQLKRINILRDAVAKFVNTVKESNAAMLADGGGDTYGGHRLSFVIFHQNVTSTDFLNVQNLTATPASGSGNSYSQATVYNGSTNIIGASTQIYTRSGDAMERAQSVLSNVDYSAAPNRTRVVVFFTDGAPGDSNNETNWQNQSGQRNEANQCITAANAIKASTAYGATIYSVGLFNKAEGAADVTTTYLRYVSSDYDNAPQIGTSAPTGGWIPVSNDKSIIVSSAGALANVFDSIATSAGGDYSASSSSSVLIDIVASSFKIPSNTDLGTVKVYKVACAQQSATSVISWGTKTEITNDVELVVSGDSVTVSGFDYGAEWCGWDGSANNNVGGPHGHKLVLEIPIEVREDAVGGPAVETNDPGSKLVIKDKQGNVIQSYEFISPTVKIPVQIWIQKAGLQGDDSAVFTIYRSPFVENFDPETAIWENRTKIVVGPEDLDPTTGLYLKKQVGLDPDFYYKIKEDAWAFGYTYQYGGVLYTVGDNVENPFKFENTPKNKKFDEASARNVFKERTTPITTGGDSSK